MSQIRYPAQLTRGAQDDVSQIYASIRATNSLQAANHWVDELVVHVQSLEILPERGNVPRELSDLGRDQYRQIIWKPYRIFYRIDGGQVLVAAVLDGRRDVITILKRRLLIL